MAKHSIISELKKFLCVLVECVQHCRLAGSIRTDRPKDLTTADAALARGEL
jgi:hypothetical protein